MESFRLFLPHGEQTNRQTNKQTNKQTKKKKQRQLLNRNPLSLIVPLFRP